MAVLASLSALQVPVACGLRAFEGDKAFELELHRQRPALRRFQRQPHPKNPRVAIRAAFALPSEVPEGSSDGGGAAAAAATEGELLATEFMRYVAETSQEWPVGNARPTALLPPTAVVKAQMDALMRNDWPEADSGVRAAFKFAMPEGANEMLIGSPVAASVRAWEAAEKFLDFAAFREMLRQPPYAPLLNCSAWEFCSPLTFHRRGDQHAVQAVRVRTSAGSADPDAPCREAVFTFILEKVVKGPYKGCWMVIGVRQGDYANV